MLLLLVCYQSKHNVFSWLLINKRLNTRELLPRKQFHIEDYNCPMCGLYALETWDHLFLKCHFASICWRYLCPGCINVISLENHWAFQRSDRGAFHLELFILTCWAIWTTRNDFIFQNIQRNLYKRRRKFKEEIKLLVHRANRKAYFQLPDWVSAFHLLSVLTPRLGSVWYIHRVGSLFFYL